MCYWRFFRCLCCVKLAPLYLIYSIMHFYCKPGPILRSEVKCKYLSPTLDKTLFNVFTSVFVESNSEKQEQYMLMIVLSFRVSSISSVVLVCPFQ